MAKVKILGRAFVITSSVQAEDLKKAKKYAPEVLTKKDDKGNEIFSVRYGNTVSIGKLGICFVDTNSAGFAYLTGSIPDCVATDKRTEFIEDQFGKILLDATAQENTINYAMTAIAGRIADIANTIEAVE